MKMRILQKLALVSSNSEIDERSVDLVARREVMRIGLGWVGTWVGLLLLVVAFIGGLACFDQLTERRPDPRTPESPESILEAQSGEIVEIALPLDFEAARTVVAAKPSKPDFFLIPPENESLAGKVWAYRGNGITVGEGKVPASSTAWLVVRRRDDFPSGWDLPADTIPLDDDEAATRYQIPDPIRSSAMVLVPGTLDELRPSVGLIVWWWFVAGVSCLLWASAAQRLLRALKFLKDRSACVRYLNRKRPR